MSIRSLDLRLVGRMTVALCAAIVVLLSGCALIALAANWDPQRVLPGVFTKQYRHMEWPLSVPIGFPEAPIEERSYGGFGWSGTEYWGEKRDARGYGFAAWCSVNHFRLGWPANCFEGFTVATYGNNENSFASSALVQCPLSARACFPIRPLWGPLIGNILCFAGIFFASMELSRSWRTYWRRKVNRCPQCNYSLAGIVNCCPECGLAVGSKKLVVPETPSARPIDLTPPSDTDDADHRPSGPR